MDAGAPASWRPSSRYPDPAIQIVDESFARYRLVNAKVEQVATGCRWAEGPVWFGDGRYLLWSDIPNDRILRWDEETAAVSLFRRPSHFANGNTRDRQGRLLTCEHGLRRVSRTEYDGTVVTVADRHDGKPLNSPNDVVVRSDGSIWFTDPPYGILGHYEGAPAKPELPTNVYRVDGRSGAMGVVADDIDRPNGLCFSPDESRLYVVQSGGSPRAIHVYDVTGAGTRLGNRRKLIEAGPGTPDGLRCDVDGTCGRAGAWGGRTSTGSASSIPTAARSAASRPRALRQRLLRGAPPQPAVHGREHVGLRAPRHTQGALGG